MLLPLLRIFIPFTFTIDFPGCWGSSSDPAAHPALGEARHDHDPDLRRAGVDRKEADQWERIASWIGKFLDFKLAHKLYPNLHSVFVILVIRVFNFTRIREEQKTENSMEKHSIS